MDRKILRNFFIYSFALVCILPLFIMVLYSFRGADGSFSLMQYGRALFQMEDFFMGFWNSIIYTFVIIGFNIPISLLSAYGFSRFDFKGKSIIYWLYIVLMLMPFQATIVAQYISLKALHIIDRPLAVILPNIFSTFGTILMSQYMMGLNKEILDAGRIDGFSEFKLFMKIVVPICRSLLSALVVLLFITYWSMVEQPLVFIKDIADMPLAVTLNSSSRFRGIEFAIGTIFTLLPILLYQYSYGDLVYGISLSSSSGLESMADIAYGGHKSKKIIFKLVVIFLILMAVFTLITEKVTYVMMPSVEVLTTRSGDLKSDPIDPLSESLGYYSSLVPSSCIYDRGQDRVIYAIVREKSKKGRTELTEVKVSVLADNGSMAAIGGGFSSDTEIVHRTSKALKNGIIVKILRTGADSYE